MTPDLPAVLAVDGGNSKTDVALVAADGSLLGTARGAGATSAAKAAVEAWLDELAVLIEQTDVMGVLADVDTAVDHGRPPRESGKPGGLGSLRAFRLVGDPSPCDNLLIRSLS